MASTNEDGYDVEDDWSWCNICQLSFKTENQSIAHHRIFHSFLHSEKVLTKEVVAAPVGNQEAAGRNMNPGKGARHRARERQRKAANSNGDWTLTTEATMEATTDATEQPLEMHMPEPPLEMTKLEEPSGQVPDEMMSQKKTAYGRTPDYYCDVCEIDCTTPYTYNQHLGGAKHKKKEERRKKIGEDVTTKLEHDLSILGQPIVGLECVQEATVGDVERLYKCYLCSIALTNYTVGSHITSRKHQKKYLEMKHPQMFEQLECKSKQEVDGMVDNFVQSVEETFGRKEILRMGENLEMKLPPMANVAMTDDKQYYCETCDTTFTSATAISIHLSGKKHRKKWQASGASKQEEASAQVTNKMGGYSENIVDGLEENFHIKVPGEPIIGLEYVSEYQYVDATHNEIRFVCHLCDIKSLTVDAFSYHVISVNHRRCYMEILFPEKYAELIKMGSNKEQKITAKLLAKEVENRHGRQKILRMAAFMDGETPIHILNLQQKKAELKADNVAQAALKAPPKDRKDGKDPTLMSDEKSRANIRNPNRDGSYSHLGPHPGPHPVGIPPVGVPHPMGSPHMGSPHMGPPHMGRYEVPGPLDSYPEMRYGGSEPPFKPREGPQRSSDHRQPEHSRSPDWRSRSPYDHVARGHSRHRHF